MLCALCLLTHKFVLPGTQTALQATCAEQSPPRPPSPGIILIHPPPIGAKHIVDMLKQHTTLCHLQHKVEVVFCDKHIPQFDHIRVVEQVMVLQPALQGRTSESC